jgi:hypothetical protein
MKAIAISWVAFMIATGVKHVVNQTGFGPSRELALSRNSGDARTRGYLAARFQLVPEATSGWTLSSADCWLEERVERRYQFVWVPENRRTGLYTLCLTVDAGGTSRLPEDCNFATKNASGETEYFGIRYLAKRPPLFCLQIDNPSTIVGKHVLLLKRGRTAPIAQMTIQPLGSE